MKDLLDSAYQFLYNDLRLATVAIVVGIGLIIAHIIALMRAGSWLEKLKSVPRSQQIGMVVLTVDFIWAYMLASSMDLGEFYRLRWLAQLAIPAFFVGLLFVANDYLGARAIGILAILAACPLLDAAFQQPPTTRLFVSALAYLWATLGLFWVGMPFTMRDQVNWVTKTMGRYQAVAVAGIAYGGLLLALGFTAFRGY
jgi:hypothetical protein